MLVEPLLYSIENMFVLPASNPALLARGAAILDGACLAGSFDPEKIRDVLASIAVYTIRGQYRAERGVSPSTEPLSIQIQNGKRLIVWPDYAAEAKALPMPKWEDRAKK